LSQTWRIAFRIYESGLNDEKIENERRVYDNIIHANSQELSPTPDVIDELDVDNPFIML
jgi:hypothetical protein